MMLAHITISDAELRCQIRNREVLFGGNSGLKIYGYLHCSSGKRMKRGNRVFFADENEALENGFRPCGNCMKPAYKTWKNGLV
jgi:methylphosphotriester-DNA--protein-cysteine methyltransferase